MKKSSKMLLLPYDANNSCHINKDNGIMVYNGIDGIDNGIDNGIMVLNWKNWL